VSTPARLSVPDGTTAGYNGVVFSGACFTKSMRLTPVPSQDGRTTIFTKYRITLGDYVKVANDDEAAAILVALQAQGGRFVYAGRSTGNLFVNFAGGPRDVCYGPVVEDLAVTPHTASGALGAAAGGGVFYIEWTVTVGLPTCADAVFAGQIMDWSWTVEYERDSSGYTKRTYQATITIPATRRNVRDRTIPDSADDYLEQIYPALLPGFRREGPGAWKLSPDKRSGTLTVTDTEMPPNYPPPGVVRAEASHSVGTEGGQWYKWQGTFAATYEIGRGHTVDGAVQDFLRILADRIAETRKAQPFAPPAAPEAGGGAGNGLGPAVAGAGLALFPQQGIPALGAQLGADHGGHFAGPGVGLGGLAGAAGGANAAGKPEKVTIIPWQWNMEDVSIYDRQRVRLSMTYKVAAVEVKEMLTHSGLWRPVPGSNWQRWAAALLPHLSARGIRQLSFDLRDDRIIDLCGPTAPPVGNGAAAPQFPADPVLAELRSVARTAELRGSGRFNPAGDLYAKPTPGGSWLHYVNAILVSGNDGVVIGQTLPTNPITGEAVLTTGGARWNPFSGALPSTGGGARNVFPPPARPTDGETFFHRRTRPVTYIHMIGAAARVGYAVPCPELTEVNGAEVVRCNREGTGEGFVTQVVGNAFWPVVAARWCHRYAVLGDVRGDLPVPATLLG
jgi:hypothetical protein